MNVLLRWVATAATLLAVLRACVTRWGQLALCVAAVVCLLEGEARANGVDSSRLPLPSGPGSIGGLGRAFVPSLASGTASTGVDIAVPPGAGGFGPHVSLDYDSGGGISDLGMGWHIGGIPSVRRCVENGLPRFDASDVFELSGFGVSGPLLEVSPGIFRPEWEPGTFVRAQRSADGATWEVRTKAGITYLFGQATEAEAGHVVTYLLDQAIDLHGHVVSYGWDTSSGHGVLQTITWNDYADDVRNAVTFGYETRPDPHTLYSTGIKQSFTQRLTRVVVTHRGGLVRRYELAYTVSDVHSRIASVTLVGSDGTTREPTLSYTYTAPSFAASGQIVGMASAPGRTPGDPNVDLADLNGDSFPDLLVTYAGQFTTYVNQDGASWQPAARWSPSQSPAVALSATGVQLADLNGDGAIDLVVKSGTTDFRYFPGAGTTGTSFGAPVSIATVPSFTFEDPDVALADMDGDRRTDVVMTTAAGIAIGYNLNGTDWTEPTALGPVDPHQSLRFSDGGHTQLCDVNGDRVEDFCYLTSGSLVWWPGRGRGAFDPPQTSSGVPTWDPSSPWSLKDLDGDGWLDLVHVAGTSADVALAIAAGSFAEVRTITGTPQVGPNTTVRFADMNGSGSLDVVWIDVADGPATAWQYLELFPAGRAGLLATIDNGLGRVETNVYAAAASDAAAARAAGSPWTARMNVAMPVVRSVKVDDGLGDPSIITEYHYSDGTFSPVERTFAGFAGGVEQANGDTYTPTLVTTSTFDVGIADRTQRGLVLTLQRADTQGYVFDAATTAYKTITIDTGLEGTSVQYTYKTSEQNTEVEGPSGSSGRTTLTEWTEDTYGNVTNESRWGEVVAGDKLAGNDEAITLRTYATDAADWLVGDLATEELQDGHGTRVAMKRFYYDGADFVGLSLGQVARGDVTRQEAWVGPDPNTFEVDITTRYNADGQPLETKDARGGGNLFTWDSHDHTTLLTKSAKTDTGVLTEHVQTDRAFGVITSAVDYDGQTSSFEYDVFGRLTAAILPGDSSALPTIKYTYLPAAPLSRVVTDARIWSGQAACEHSEALMDGFGRKRGSLTEDDGGRWVLAGVSLLDARGAGHKKLRARFATQAEHDAPPLLADGSGDSSWYDASRRVLRTLTKLGIATRTEYAPFVTRAWDGAQNDPTSPYEHTPVTKENDGLGRLVRTTYVLGGAPLGETYAYDAAGALVSKTDAESNVARYTYDGRGRRLTVDDPDSGHHSFVYDATGNEVEHHKPDGTVTRSTFDLGGRPLTEDWDGDGTPEVVHTWDRSDRHPSEPLYAGKLVRMTDPSGSIENEYDARQRVVATHQTIDGHTYDGASLFDDRDREAVHTYPDGSSLRILFNPRGQLAGYGRAVTFAYDGDGVELSRTFNTGVVQTTGYDADRRKTESRATTPNGATLQDLAWTYDGAGNIASVQDRRAGVNAAHDRSETYTLDNLYRLRSATGKWGTATWSYSPSGNVLLRESDVAALNAGALAYGQNVGPHALTSFMGRSLKYDALGRMLSDGERSYAWDANDQLVHVTSTNGAKVDSTFDGAGIRRLRVETMADGSTHRTAFLDPWSEARDGKLVRYIVHGGRRIAQLAENTGLPSSANAAAGAGRITSDAEERLTSGSMGGVGGTISLCVALALLSALLARGAGALLGSARRGFVPLVALVCLAGASCSKSPDSQASPLAGSIQTLSDADELLFDDAIGTLTEETSGTGTSRATFASYPYGLARFDTSTQTRKYARSPRDGSVGLDQMGARSFAPDLGVWTSADPVAVEDPVRGVGSSPGDANPYGYAGSNPTIAIDEHGHWLQIAIGAFIGGAIGGGLEAYRQYSETGHIDNWGRVAAKTAVGAVAGGVFAALPTPATAAGLLALGGAESTAQGAAERLIDSGGKSAGTLGDAAKDFAIGAGTAGLSVAGGAVVKKVAAAVVERAGSSARSIGAALKVKSGLKAGGGSGVAHGPSYGDLTKAGLKDAHHVIQDAAVKDLPGYSRRAAPAVQLAGPSTARGTAHYMATQAQRQAGGGTYAAERRIAYKALRKAGFDESAARGEIQRADSYFSSIGVTPNTPTRIPGNR